MSGTPGEAEKRMATVGADEQSFISAKLIDRCVRAYMDSVDHGDELAQTRALEPLMSKSDDFYRALNINYVLRDGAAPVLLTAEALASTGQTFLHDAIVRNWHSFSPRPDLNLRYGKGGSSKSDSAMKIFAFICYRAFHVDHFVLLDLMLQGGTYFLDQADWRQLSKMPVNIGLCYPKADPEKHTELTERWLRASESFEEIASSIDLVEEALKQSTAAESTVSLESVMQIYQSEKISKRHQAMFTTSAYELLVKSATPPEVLIQSLNLVPKALYEYCPKVEEAFKELMRSRATETKIAEVRSEAPEVNVVVESEQKAASQAALCCLRDYCSIDPAKVEAAEQLIEKATDEFFAKLDVNTCYSGPRGDGVSILWQAVWAHVEGKPLFMRRLMKVWDSLDPKPNITLFPKSTDHHSYGVDSLWVSISGRLSGSSQVYDFFATQCENFTPRPNINSHALKKDWPAVGKSTLYRLIELNMGDSPTESDTRLLNYVIKEWEVLRPNVNLGALNLGGHDYGVTALLLVAVASREIISTLNDVICKSWESLSPKPNVNASFEDPSSAMHGTTVLWVAQARASVGNSMLWNTIINEGWDDLSPRPDLNAAPKDPSHKNKGTTVFSCEVVNSANTGNYAALDNMLREGTYDVPSSLWLQMAKMEWPSDAAQETCARIGKLMLTLEREVEVMQSVGVLEKPTSRAITEIIEYLEDASESDRNKAILATCAYRHLDRCKVNKSGADCLIRQLPSFAYCFAPVLFRTLVAHSRAGAGAGGPSAYKRVQNADSAADLISRCVDSYAKASAPIDKEKQRGAFLPLEKKGEDFWRTVNINKLNDDAPIISQAILVHSLGQEFLLDAIVKHWHLFYPRPDLNLKCLTSSHLKHTSVLSIFALTCYHAFHTNNFKLLDLMLEEGTYVLAQEDWEQISLLPLDSKLLNFRNIKRERELMKRWEAERSSFSEVATKIRLIKRAPKYFNPAAYPALIREIAQIYQPGKISIRHQAMFTTSAYQLFKEELKVSDDTLCAFLRSVPKEVYEYCPKVAKAFEELERSLSPKTAKSKKKRRGHKTKKMVSDAIGESVLTTATKLSSETKLVLDCAKQFFEAKGDKEIKAIDPSVLATLNPIEAMDDYLFATVDVNAVIVIGGGFKGSLFLDDLFATDDVHTIIEKEGFKGSIFQFACYLSLSGATDFLVEKINGVRHERARLVLPFPIVHRSLIWPGSTYDGKSAFYMALEAHMRGKPLLYDVVRSWAVLQTRDLDVSMSAAIRSDDTLLCKDGVTLLDLMRRTNQRHWIKYVKDSPEIFNVEAAIEKSCFSTPMASAAVGAGGHLSESFFAAVPEG